MYNNTQYNSCSHTGESIWHLDCDGGVVRGGSHEPNNSSPILEVENATGTSNEHNYYESCLAIA